jgi:hypothetical protein
MPKKEKRKIVSLSIKKNPVYLVVWGNNLI